MLNEGQGPYGIFYKTFVETELAMKFVETELAMRFVETESAMRLATCRLKNWLEASVSRFGENPENWHETLLKSASAACNELHTSVLSFHMGLVLYGPYDGLLKYFKSIMGYYQMLVKFWALSQVIFQVLDVPTGLVRSLFVRMTRFFDNIDQAKSAKGIPFIAPTPYAEILPHVYRCYCFTTIHPDCLDRLKKILEHSQGEVRAPIFPVPPISEQFTFSRTFSRGKKRPREDETGDRETHGNETRTEPYMMRKSTLAQREKCAKRKRRV